MASGRLPGSWDTRPTLSNERMVLSGLCSQEVFGRVGILWDEY